MMCSSDDFIHRSAKVVRWEAVGVGVGGGRGGVRAACVAAEMVSPRFKQLMTDSIMN